MSAYSSSDVLVQVNGFWVDLTTVESTLLLSLSSYSIISVKVVSLSSASRFALFFTSLAAIDELTFLKSARDVLETCVEFPESLASMISFARQLPEMPVDEDGDVDVSALRSIAAERLEQRRQSRRSRAPMLHATSPPANMPHTSLSAFSSTTFSPSLPTIAIHSPESTPSPKATFTHESLSPLPSSFSPRHNTTPTYAPPTRPSSIMDISKRSIIALEVASHITTLLSLPASAAVPTYLPLKLAGLNSITTHQLYFWLQERYEYDEDISTLFEDDVSSETIAIHLTGKFGRSNYSRVVLNLSFV